MYSKDRGETWTIHHHVRNQTHRSTSGTASAGHFNAEHGDNRGGSRAVYTTHLGKTWKEHESSLNRFDRARMYGQSDQV